MSARSERSGDLHRSEGIGKRRCGYGGVVDGRRGGSLLGEIEGELFILSIGCIAEELSVSWDAARGENDDNDSRFASRNLARAVAAELRREVVVELTRSVVATFGRGAKSVGGRKSEPSGREKGWEDSYDSEGKDCVICEICRRPVRRIALSSAAGGEIRRGLLRRRSRRRGALRCQSRSD